MGTKATAKDMVEIIDLISHDLKLYEENRLKLNNLLRVLDKDPDYKQQYSEVNRVISNIQLNIHNNLKKLTESAYTEERVEQIIKQIIERTKADVIKLIQADEAFTKDEKAATEILQELRSIFSKREVGGVWNVIPFKSSLDRLRALLVKDADIAEAVQIVARDLEKLMQTLQKTEK